MEKRDFYFSLFLLALGAGVVSESLRMPRMEAFGYGPYAAPGLVPGLIGAAIAVCAILLLIRSIRARRSGSESPTSAEEESPIQIKALAVTLGLVVIYAVGLVGTVPFWLATFLFMFAFILYFEWKRSATRMRRIRSVATAFVQAVVTAAAVTLLFEQVFRVNLPG
ncbi:MAG TPA: tripartite tricarboxylate transporter TctB family protein [Opitutales bacterium]|nr:tripartite tricarboxylate transporter TctB family protein [Opitutales bacterium]